MSKSEASGSGQPYTILVVEDHDALRELLRTWLAGEFPVCRHLSVATGEDAIAVTAEEHPDLVLMDVELPGINGIDAMREIRKLAPDAQIVVLSNHDGAYFRDMAEAQGARAYVPKRSMHMLLIPLLSKVIACNRPQE